MISVTIGVVIGFLLTAVETGLGMYYHSSLLQMSLSSAIMGFLVSFEGLLGWKNDPRGMLVRVASLVAVTAMLFINQSHCFESLTDFLHNNTHNDEDHSHAIISRVVMMASVGDLLAKGILFVLIANPFFSLFHLAFLVSSPAFTIIFLSMVDYIGILGSSTWSRTHAEAICCLLLTAMHYYVLVNNLKGYKRYLLADAPPKENFEKLESKLVGSYPAVRKLSHLHAHYIWPGDGFAATMNIHISVNKSDPDWVIECARTYECAKHDTKESLKRAGAVKVSIEPIFEELGREFNTSEAICIDRKCHQTDVGCCTYED